ncbi:hypothetical protein [Paenibacillus gorillae]|uniref:hypothetical protein n=1 Tax=Paenibacillus gorillae TaxID=1243662 RepID=UPI0004BBE33A|nr:hypothetical protein [Paenibacillus gorillae]
MKRQADIGKQHGKQAGTATSVQPFAGGIMSKYKSSRKDIFSRISMSHRLKQQEDTPTEHRIFVKVTAPAEKKEPKQPGRAALPVIKQKPLAEKVIREKVIVERERIIFRDLSRIIQESRMIRETAVTQQVEVSRTTSQQMKDTAAGVVSKGKMERDEGQQLLALSQGFRVKRLTMSSPQEAVKLSRPMIMKIKHPIQKTEEQSASSSSNRNFNRWKSNEELQTLIAKAKRMSRPSQERSSAKLEHLVKKEQLMRLQEAASGQKTDASSFRAEHGGRKAAETGEGQRKRSEPSIAGETESDKRLEVKHSKSVERSNRSERGEAVEPFSAKKNMRARAVITQAMQPQKAAEQVHTKPSRAEQEQKEKDTNGSSKQVPVVQARAEQTIAAERGRGSSKVNSMQSAEIADWTNSKEPKTARAVMRANVTGLNAVEQVHIKPSTAGQTESPGNGQESAESKSSDVREQGKVRQADVIKQVSPNPLPGTVQISQTAVQSGAEEKANGAAARIHVVQPQKTVEQVHMKPSEGLQAQALENKQAKAGQALSEQFKVESASREDRVRSESTVNTADLSDVMEQPVNEATRSMQARSIARANVTELQQTVDQVHAKPGGAEQVDKVGNGQTNVVQTNTEQMKSVERLKESIRGNAVQSPSVADEQTNTKQSMQARAIVQSNEAVVQRAAEQVHTKPSGTKQAEAVESERVKAEQVKAVEGVRAQAEQAKALERERAQAEQAGTGERASAIARANAAAEPQKAAEQVHAKPSGVRQAKAVEGVRTKAAQAITGERAVAIARANAAAEPQKAAEQVHAKPSGVRQAEAVESERTKAAQPLHAFVLRRHKVSGTSTATATATSGLAWHDNSQPANPMLSYASAASSAPQAGAPLPALSHPKAKVTAKEPERIVQVDAPKELDPEKLQKIIMQMPQLNPEAIADKVYLALERKMKLEQRRRGI